MMNIKILIIILVIVCFFSCNEDEYVNNSNCQDEAAFTSNYALRMGYKTLIAYGICREPDYHVHTIYLTDNGWYWLMFNDGNPYSVPEDEMKWERIEEYIHPSDYAERVKGWNENYYEDT